MPFQVACPGCQKKYQLADEMRGKTIRCQTCSKAFKIPAPQQPPSKVETVPSQRVAPSRQQQQQTAPPPQQQQNMSTLQSENIFANQSPNPKFDPLANHVVQDPGFAYVDPSKYAKPPEPDYQNDSLFYNPATAALAQQVERESQQNVVAGHQHTWWPVYVGGGAVLLTLLVALPLMFVGEGVAVLGLLLAGLTAGMVLAASDIWLLVIIYMHNRPQFVLCFFIAFFRYQFLNKNWSVFKDVGILYTIGVIGVISAAGMSFLMGVLYGG